MLESFKGKQFTYKPLTQEEREKRGILGRLVGPIADTTAPTRNGRMYSKDLWEHVFDDPIMQEKIKNRCLFQELGHPEDRTEVDMEKICSCLAETPKIGEDGLLYGVFDILPTKNGQLLKILCDYGTTIGISSRGTGDVIDNGDGEEVDPSTYDCETFDFVILPAVEKARMSYVNESLGKSNGKVLNLREALKQEIDKASDEDKKAMQETLSALKIDLEEPKEEGSNIVKDDEDTKEASKDSKEAINESKDAINDGSDELVKSLQESIVKSAELEQKVKALQEQLAVSNAEVGKLRGENGRQRSAIINLTRQVRESKDESNRRTSSLEGMLDEKEKAITQLKEDAKRLKSSMGSAKALRESVSSQMREAKRLNESLAEKDAKIEGLNEALTKERQDSACKIGKLNEEISKAKRVAEGYKRLANSTCDKYIELKATMLGMTPEAIKSNLSESYTLDEIDKVCSRLQGDEMGLSRLPFKVGKKTVVKVNESKQPTQQPQRRNIYDDDYVDEGLMRVAGIVK